MIKLSRRSFLILTSMVSPVFSRIAFANQDYTPLGHLPPLPPQYASLSNEEPMNGEFGNELLVQGTLQPSSAEVAVARQIIDAADALSQSRPVEIAGFLLEVARGTHGNDWQPYTRAWPKDAHANPLILDFFSAAKCSPKGDETAWCAAFVSWCILKGRKGAPTASLDKVPKNAGSSSFRTWGEPVVTFDTSSSVVRTHSAPQIGDLVVFQEMRANGTPDPTYGHVTFFVGMDGTRIQCLGGNQFEGHPTVHAINVKWIPIDGKLRLHSIRRNGIL
ncbi:CHAP domain-containing protein [Rhizobium ruizarguesonis]|uniref:CHAP domain-containing protein n=1 Tax=Rhizobium ruizarguesonis TaxID=2081791 RepID=UPI001FDFE989|nr:CHAP domain-containing protein [Rhizobium ruizarguesonis]